MTDIPEPTEPVEPDPTEPTEPTAPIEPLEPFTEAEIIEKARGLITGEYLLADTRDPDWESSLLLMLCGMEGKWAPNTSTMFLVPLAPHAHGHWLNGRVPGVTTSCLPVPIESCAALMDKAQEFWRALNPDVAPVPQSGP